MSLMDPPISTSQPKRYFQTVSGMIRDQFVVLQMALLRLRQDHLSGAIDDDEFFSSERSLTQAISELLSIEAFFSTKVVQ